MPVVHVTIRPSQCSNTNNYIEQNGIFPSIPNNVNIHQDYSDKSSNNQPTMEWPRIQRYSYSFAQPSYNVPITDHWNRHSQQQIHPTTRNSVGNHGTLFKTTTHQLRSSIVSHQQDIVTNQFHHTEKGMTNEWSDKRDATIDYHRNLEKNKKRKCTPQCALISIACVFLFGTLIAAIPLLILIKPDTTLTTTAIPTTTTISTTTDIPCSTTCTLQQTCVRGGCIGVGYLSCTLTWSRIGDGDIVVATPNYNIIYYGNLGPSMSTDQGQLDIDNKNGTGPENVFWSNSSSVPPTGTYYVCFSQYSFTPSVSSSYPITATVKVRYWTNIILTFTKNFTSYYQDYLSCDSTSAGLVASFTYP